MNRRAFVFTGLVFLLLIPSVILAASFTNMIKIGDTATSVAVKSDAVYYPYHTVELNFRKTLCNYIYLNLNGSTVNASGVLEDILTTWVPSIENDFTTTSGVNIDIDESDINISYNTLNTNVLISGSASADSPIGINITDPNQNIYFEGTLGPYTLPRNCGTSTTTSQSVCQDSTLTVNPIYPPDSHSNNTCANISITANATTYACGTLLTGGTHTFTALVDNEDLSITMNDQGTSVDETADDGIYTGLWETPDLGTTNITITGTHTDGWTGTANISNVIITAGCNNIAPQSNITSPSNGTSYTCGDSPVTILGNASDPPGDNITQVEISTDGGSSWNYANGTTNWNYSWGFIIADTYNIKSRATDNESALETPGNGIYVSVTGGCIEAPSSNITSHSDDDYQTCSLNVIEGTASSPNGTLTNVNISTDGGATWTTANGTTNWNYTWNPSSNGDYLIKSQASDTYGAETPGSGINVSVIDCPVSACTNLWSGSANMSDRWKSTNNGAYAVDKSSDPASSKYAADYGITCDDQDKHHMELKEKESSTEHKRLEYTWYNESLPDVDAGDLCSLNLTVKYHVEKNKMDDVTNAIDLFLNVTNLQNDVSRLYDIADTKEDEDDADNWHEFNMTWPAAPTFTTDADLTFRIQAYPESNSSWPDNNDEIKIFPGDCMDQITLQIASS